MTIPHNLAIPYATHDLGGQYLLYFISEHEAEIAYDAWKSVCACKLVEHKGVSRTLWISSKAMYDYSDAELTDNLTGQQLKDALRKGLGKRDRKD